MKRFLIFLLPALLGGQKVFGQTDVFKTASWIASALSEQPGPSTCVVFIKEMHFSKPVARAILSITAQGLYEGYLNGHRIGKDYFTPGFTNYNVRLPYQEYDVKTLLENNNRLEVTVAGGWYSGPFRGAGGDQGRHNYGTRLALLAELHVCYADGTTDVIATDNSWQWVESGIRYAELYNGELSDGTFVPGSPKPVDLLDGPWASLVRQEAEPVRMQERFRPVQIFSTPKGDQVVDFGQNMAGWVRLILQGKRGDTVRLYHAEVLDKAGNFYQGNLRSAKAVDTYVLSGKRDVLEPHFTYHGFRYVKVEGFMAKPGNLEAVALYSDLPKTGLFSCSDSLVNRLQKNIVWSMNSNFFDIPTDCPQRSERLGWTGDAEVFASTGSFLKDTRKFYAKWLRDLASEQGRNGGVPNIVPSVIPYTEIRQGVAGWGDAATIVPWALYRAYADTAVLREQYISMKAWVDYVDRGSPNGYWNAKGFGDWYAPGEKTDMQLINQCFWANSTAILVESASLLKKAEDVAKYSRMLERVKSCFITRHLDARTGRLTGDTQSAYVLALEFGMLPEQYRQAAADRLVELIHANKDHLATGFLGTPYLLKVLSDYGYSDVAYTLLNQQTYPSWLYSTVNGATTIWEKWDGIDPKTGDVTASSYNHFSYGAVGRWLYEYIAGIRPATPGYQKILIKPEIGGNLTWAKGSYKCRYGKIVSEWEVKGSKVTLHVTIPKGTTAEVHIPGGDVKEFGPGSYLLHGSRSDGIGLR